MLSGGEGTPLELKKQAIRILVADHKSLFRQGLLTLIGSERDFQILGVSEDCRQLERELLAAAPDVTIVARDLPGLNGLAGLQALCKTGSQLLLLNAGADEGQPNGLDSAGVAACITREEASRFILPLIRQLVRQNSTLSLQNLSMTVQQLRSLSSSPSAAPAGPALTARENEILRFLAAGDTVKDAATELNLSVKTVEAHKFNLMRKLNLHTRADVLAYARDHGIAAQPVVA
jgi:two-component system response regulator NreC